MRTLPDIHAKQNSPMILDNFNKFDEVDEKFSHSINDDSNIQNYTNQVTGTENMNNNRTLKEL